MRIIIFLCALLALISCKYNAGEYNKVSIAETSDSLKIVSAELHYVDTINFVLPTSIPDSIILKGIKHYTDSLRQDSVRRDSLQVLNFRRITKIINGGYNGYTDRVRLWENAKKTLK